MAKKALGKGLGAIFGEDAKSLKKKNTVDTKIVADKIRDAEVSVSAQAKEYEPYFAESGAEEVRSDRTEKEENVSRETLVKLSLIEPNLSQPRKKFEETALNELSESIRNYGVLQPLLVRRNGAMYELIAGERRWRAAKIAGLKEVPVIVKDFADRERAEIALIENIQREDLGPVEEARAYQTLIREYGLTQEQLAERLSKSRSTITNTLRLLQLSDVVLAHLEEGTLSAGHARCLIPVEDINRQEALAEQIIAENLSVRETEKLIKKASSKNTRGDGAEKKEDEINMYLLDLARKLTGSLNTKVRIKQGKKGQGKIEISYYSNDDLEKIIGKLR